MFIPADGDSKARKIWKSLGIVAIMGLIGIMVFLSQNFGHDSHGRAHARSHEVVSGSGSDYLFNSMVSRLSEEDSSVSEFLKEDCFFGAEPGVQLDESNFDEFVRRLFGESDTRSTQYHVSNIVKPKYNVEWVFGNSMDLNTGENEHFTIVLQKDLVDTTKIKQFHVFSSRNNEVCCLFGNLSVSISTFSVSYSAGRFAKAPFVFYSLFCFVFWNHCCA